MSAPAQGSGAANAPVVIAYCVHCRERRQMSNAIQVCNRRGKHDLKGHCSVCGKAMYRLGGWDSLAAAAQAAPNAAAVDAPGTSAQEVAPDPTPTRTDVDAAT